MGRGASELRPAPGASLLYGRRGPGPLPDNRQVRRAIDLIYDGRTDLGGVEGDRLLTALVDHALQSNPKTWGSVDGKPQTFEDWTAALTMDTYRRFGNAYIGSEALYASRIAEESRTKAKHLLRDKARRWRKRPNWPTLQKQICANARELAAGSVAVAFEKAAPGTLRLWQKGLDRDLLYSREGYVGDGLVAWHRAWLAHPGPDPDAVSARRAAVVKRMNSRYPKFKTREIPDFRRPPEPPPTNDEA